MQNWARYIVLSLFFAACFISSPNYAQFFRYSETPIDVEASFTLHSLESSAKQTFFNALKIKNNANRTEFLILNITVPQGWNVIGDDRIEISLPPQDSIIIPLRVAVGGMVKGDIGYSVIASITDTRGNTVKNEYCFVKIPRDVDLTVRFLDRMGYLDPISGSSSLSIFVRNRGNRDEFVNLLLDGNNHIGLGQLRSKLFAQDINVPPYTDTTLTYNVELREQEVFGRNMYGVKVIASTIDTTFKSTIWFRNLDTEFFNFVPPSEKPLVVELSSQGLLQADAKPMFIASIQGKTLFDGNSEVYYYYRNFSSRSNQDLYLNNRMYIGGIWGPWNLEIGDNYRNFEGSLFGRGGYLSFFNKNHHAELIANRNMKSNSENLGGRYTYNFNSKTSVKLGGTYTNNIRDNINSKIGFIGSTFSIAKRHQFYTLLALNQLNQEIDNKKEHNEFGGEIQYSSRIGKVYSYAKVRYGSPLYAGNYGGRLEVNAKSQWQIKPLHRLAASYSVSNNFKPQIQNSSIVRTRKSINNEYKLEYTYFATPSLHIYGGPGVDQYVWSGVYFIPENDPFGSLGYKINAGVRIKNQTGTTSLSPQVTFARVNINEFPSVSESGGNLTWRKEWFNYQYFSINYRSRYYNVLASYTSGPKSVVEQINYFFQGKPNRKLQFMPFFDGFVYKDVIKVHLGLSYNNDMVARSSYSNITGQVTWYLPKNWNINVLSIYSLQSRTNPQEVVETYQNLYVEAGIRKEFNLNQPRVKYYNVNLVFFKDFNGNYLQDPNEPGIKNVLVNITKEGSDVRGEIPGDFISAELLSNNYGIVRLEKIPEGRYNVLYNPIGQDAGTFSKALEDMVITVNKSGEIFFPFVEKNKVYGKIVLNRSRLSGLGRIDLSNVRVTATDSQGRSFSTLTNNEGDFILFAPVTDEYILNINNIFYENFDLRQNNYVVQFNGYKQFELNFVFDEKVRRINFAASDPDLQSGVQQVRRTTISGVIKDANTQQPVRARVNLINTRTNSVITSTNSSATSGEYTMNFIAGESYLLEILADDYWYLSENLVLQQITTFMNITRDVLLRPVSIGSKVELNIRFDVNSAFLAPESVAELNRLLRQIKNNPTVKLEIQGHSDELEAIRRPGVALERANAVASYLIENGFSNLEVKSYDNAVPAASNDTEEGRLRNRRIEVVVLSR